MNICWTLPLRDQNVPLPKYLLQAWGENSGASPWYLVFDFVDKDKAATDSSTIEAFLLQRRESAVDNAAVTFVPPIPPR